MEPHSIAAVLQMTVGVRSYVMMCLLSVEDNLKLSLFDMNCVRPYIGDLSREKVLEPFLAPLQKPKEVLPLPIGTRGNLLKLFETLTI